MWVKIIEVRWTPEFDTNSLLFLLPQGGKSAAGRFGPPNLTGQYVLFFRLFLINSCRPGAILEKQNENPGGFVIIIRRSSVHPRQPAAARWRVPSDRRSEPDFTRTGDQDDVSMDKPNSLKL